MLCWIPPCVRTKLLTAWYRRKNDGLWLLVYTVGNLCVFWLRSREYPVDVCVAAWPAVAKGSAEVVMLNCVLALAAVCHRWLDQLRRWTTKSCMQRPLEMHRQLHVLTGSVTLLMGLVHSYAWACIVFLARGCDASDWGNSFVAKRGARVVRTTDSIGRLARDLPMWTGLVLLLISVAFLPFCAPPVRRRRFTLFERAHCFLLTPFLLLLIFHGAAQWTSRLQAPLWLLPALVLYIMERYHRVSTDTLSSVISFSILEAKTAHTIQLFLTKTHGFRRRFRPGMVRPATALLLLLLFMAMQFVYLQIPSVSCIEWHPFSVASAPDDSLVELRIRVVGDWTTALLSLLRSLPVLTPCSLSARLDGPFGTPTQHYLQYDSVVFVALGVGITPFHSVLRHHLHQWRAALKRGELMLRPMLSLTWVVRDVHETQWLLDSLADFPDVLALADASLSIDLFVTSPDAASPPLFSPVIHLHPFGQRPDWSQAVAAWGSSHQTLGIFVCGGSMAISDIRRRAAQLRAHTSRRIDVFAEAFC